MTIWLMRIVCWTTKATHTLRICNICWSSTATMVARTRAMLRYTYFACLVLNSKHVVHKITTDPWRVNIGKVFNSVVSSISCAAQYMSKAKSLICWILQLLVTKVNLLNIYFNPLNTELNSICYLLALGAHHFLHVSRIRVKLLTFRLLMSYIWSTHFWCF